MDRTDLDLSRILLQDSRTSFRELADRMGLSVPVVHARIRALQRTGVIRGFTARISRAYLRTPTVIVFGTTQASNPAHLYDPLGAEDHTWWVATAGANALYVGGYLRDYGELDAYAAFVAKQAEMSDATVGLLPPPPLPRARGEPFLLDRVDARIIRALAQDSRRPIAEVASEVGLSAKTTSRRLQRLVREEAVEFSIEWYPDASDDILPVFHIRLKPGADAHEVASGLWNRYRRDLLLIHAFSNLPNALMAVFWTNSMKGLKELQAQVQAEPTTEAAMANVIYTGRLFDTWRDRVVLEPTGTRPLGTRRASGTERASRL